MNSADEILNKIKKDCHKPISSDWVKKLVHAKDTVLLDNSDQSLLVNLINAQPIAHDSWFNFYFDNYKFEDLVRINRRKNENKQIIKVINALISRKDLPKVKQYWEWLGQSNKQYVPLEHTYGHNKNLLHLCIDTGFDEGLVFFHKFLPDGLEKHAKSAQDTLARNSLDLALSRSGIGNSKVICYILNRINFDEELKTIKESAKMFGQMDRIRVAKAYFVSDIELLSKQQLLYSVITRLYINLNYFVNQDIFSAFISNEGLDLTDKKIILNSYQNIIEKELFMQKTVFKPGTPLYLKTFAPWTASHYLIILSKIIELNNFKDNNLDELKNSMAQPNTMFAATSVEEKQKFISFFEKYCLEHELKLVNCNSSSENTKSANKL